MAGFCISKQIMFGGKLIVIAGDTTINVSLANGLWRMLTKQLIISSDPYEATHPTGSDEIRRRQRYNCWKLKVNHFACLPREDRNRRWVRPMVLVVDMMMIIMVVIESSSSSSV